MTDKLSVNTHFANYIYEKLPVKGQLTNLWAGSEKMNANFACAKNVVHASRPENWPGFLYPARKLKPMLPCIGVVNFQHDVIINDGIFSI